MPHKCLARIVKTYKKAKADSYWPNHKNAAKHPICGGDIHLSVYLVSGGCHCCSYDDGPRIEIESSCSKCNSPYIVGSEDFTYEAEQVINDLLNK